MNSSGKKYGLQLRAPIPPKKPSIHARPPLGFQNNDDEEDVEDEIARQASKKRSHKDVEQQHKQALEEDPSVFDYDGVYDEMKSKITRPLEQDRVKRESKYIGKLIHKAQIRKQEQEIIYERQLAKERSKEDHLFADKEKFVTAAYKKKLAEQKQWLEEERLRELREEANDVTKKGDMGEFYRNLLKKNVAFGANMGKKDVVLPSRQHAESEKESQHSEAHSDKPSSLINTEPSDLKASNVLDESKPQVKRGRSEEDLDKDNIEELRFPSIISATQADGGLQPEKVGITANIGDKPETVSENVKSTGHDHRQSQEALAAAKERYLARKRMREV